MAKTILKNPKDKSTRKRTALENFQFKNAQAEGKPSSSMNLTKLEDGGFEVELLEEEDDVFEEKPKVAYNEDEHYKNLVDELDEDLLAALGATILENVRNDEEARKEWMDTIEMGLDLLGLKLEEKTEPFEGACSAQHPLLMESAVKFQSKSSNELLPANGPVRVKISGESTVEKEKQATRIKNHMNHQITEDMTEFYTDSEKLLLYLPLIGSAFKKVYYDDHLERPVSEFIPADQFIVPNNASDLFRAERYTHELNKSYYQLEDAFASGFYTKPEGGLLPGNESFQNDVQEKASEIIGVEVSMTDRQKMFKLYEQHITCCIEGLDEDGSTEEYERASPYIVTVEEASGKVLGLRRNWKKGDEKRRKRVSFVHYSFVPNAFGFYSLGFLHLLGNLQLTLTSSLRSLVDAGQFANLQGGFKLKGVRISDDGAPIRPGQFKDIESSINDINKAIMPLPFKEPSQVLYAMLEFLDAKGQKFADATEQIIGDSTNYGPVGTTLALLDASTKFFSAIHKRLHNSLKQELRLIAEINAETLTTVQTEENDVATREDYSSNPDIVPVSDPNISSNAHRMAKAQTLLEISMRAPEMHDMREILKHVYTAMDYQNIEKILPEADKAQNNDPMTDIKMATEGKPIKAFEGQDHEAHIALKKAFLQDPMSGGNSMMQKAAIILQANIQEHMLLMFMANTQALAQQQGAPLEQAAAQLAQMNVEKLQKEQEANNQNTPADKAALMLAQAELLDTQTQARKQQFEEQYKVAQLELDKEKLDLDKIREVRRADEFDMELLHEADKLVNTKALDAMIESLRPPKSAPKTKE